MKDPTEPFRFSFPDLDGKLVSNTDPQFRGKVVIVSIAGSWCPNCHDEAPFLTELYKKYHDKGLEIVALSFEEEAQLKDPVRLRAFIKRYGIDYTVLIPGEPKELNDKVPQGENLNSFPTSFFIGRDGRVRSVHAGFPGKSTGKFHDEAKAGDHGARRAPAREKPAQTSASQVGIDGRRVIDPATSIGAVHLTIADLTRSVGFYEVAPRLHRPSARRSDRLARRRRSRSPGPLAVGDRAARPRHDRAVSLRDPRAVARRSRALAAPPGRDRGRCMQGAADHGVSEALYLADPDGNGIEIYRDRPREQWPLRPTASCGWAPIRSTSTALLAEPSRRMTAARWPRRHGDRPRAPARSRGSTTRSAFYVGVLGFELMQRYGPSALFVSAGGYHHHIGLNTWAGVGAPPPPPGAIGLHHFVVAAARRGGGRGGGRTLRARRAFRSETRRRRAARSAIRPANAVQLRIRNSELEFRIRAPSFEISLILNSKSSSDSARLRRMRASRLRSSCHRRAGRRSQPADRCRRAAQTPAFDLVIRNGRIVDGTGSPWYRGDLAVRGDTIARIAPRIDAPAARDDRRGGQGRRRPASSTSTPTRAAASSRCRRRTTTCARA